MNPTPVLRPLHLDHPVDLDREASRHGLRPADLAALIPAPPRRLFALSALPAAGARALEEEAAAIGIATWRSANGAKDEGSASRHSDEAGSTSRTSGDTGPSPNGSVSCFVAADEREIADLLARLPAPAAGAAPFAGLPTAGAIACRRRSLPLGPRPLIMGVLNVTPDSFSDGGTYAAPAPAIERARRMVAEGADLIDVGGESTRPGAKPVSETEELDRLLPVLEGLGGDFAAPVSVDTYKAGVARRAIEAGADIVNDVTGLQSGPELAVVAAEAGCPLVLSHIRGEPRTMQQSPRYQDLMAEIAAELVASARLAVRHGVAPERIVLDPGIGFGKSFEDNLEILRRLPELRGLGLPLLVGVSRKSFLGRILDRPPLQRLEGSLAAAETARAGGAAILRVHDVAATKRFLDTVGAIRNWPPAGEDA